MTLLRALLYLLSGIAACLIAGFATFTIDAFIPTHAPPHCDGIAALTGGQDRIAAAVTLLRAGYAPSLLISGVGRHATLDQLDTDDLDAFAAHITLGRRAITTIGNALEAAQWARDQHLRSVIVVTAGYHMRRALIEMHRQAPDIIFVPFTVQPPALRHPLNRATIVLLGREYAKLLGAWCGMTRGPPMH